MFKFTSVILFIISSWQVCDVSGQLQVCAAATPECSDEPNSVCEGAGTNCVCIATFVVNTAGTDCDQLTCTLDANACVTDDANSYCDTTDANKCKCKTNYIGTRVDCFRQSCTNDRDCRYLFNAYCAAGGSDDGCTCGFNAPADPTIGVCKPISCTLANAVTTCTGRALCIAPTETFQCACGVNMIPGATSCVQMTCSSAVDCYADSICNNNICECASGFTASGNKCKRQCTGDGVGVCNVQSTCTNGVCECNVNYVGNGATYTQLTCTGTDSSSCHPNSQCYFNLCICATGFVVDGTICRKSCTAATSNTDCSSNAICINDKCKCKQNYLGDGKICEQKTCSAATDCPGTNTACSSNLCTCDTGYEISSTAIECVQSSTCTDTATATTTTTTTTTTTITSTKTSTNTEL